jgi:hypothetical protein
MRWRAIWRDEQSIKAAAFRRVHERWLEQALKRPERVARIPIRLAADGGFSRLMSRASGRLAVERWWQRVLSSSDRRDD